MIDTCLDFVKGLLDSLIDTGINRESESGRRGKRRKERRKDTSGSKLTYSVCCYILVKRTEGHSGDGGGTQAY